MDLQTMIEKFSDTPARQQKAAFNLFFMLANQMQTLFDQRIPELTLKQFLLVSVIRQSDAPMSLSQCGMFLGCSRQNVRKLADVLVKKGFIHMEKDAGDPRKVNLIPTQKAHTFFEEIFPVYADQLQILFSAFSDAEIKELLEILMKLDKGLHLLEEHTADPSQST